jgi:hypothetical protein
VAGPGLAAFLATMSRLPEVTEHPHQESTGYRVRGKGFSYLSHAGDTAIVKATLEERSALLAANPAVYSPSHTSGRFGWVTVHLDRADPAEVTELVTEAHRLTAPKSLH